MTEQEALALMKAPGQLRPSKPYRGGVIQIHLTRACDKSCFGCTQGSNLGGKTTFISPEHFDLACQSLKGYFGVVGVFGGNPALHPQFVELCAILRRHFPKEQCGLWCNNPVTREKAEAMRLTFNPGYSNLNVHLDSEAYRNFKRWWPESQPFGLNDDSRHSPPYVAMKDVIEDEGKRWELISGCDINQRWSAMIGVFRGQLRCYFCEIAGAQSILHQDELDWPDLGLAIEDGWWRKEMADFAEQVRWSCHRCGVPLRGYGSLSQASDRDGVEQCSSTHASVYRLKRRDRVLQIVNDLEQLGVGRLKDVTKYVQNAKL